MGAAFSKVIDNMKTKSETNSAQIRANELNVKLLKDDNITQFVFVIEEDIFIEDETGILVMPIIEPNLNFEKEVPMDVKELMKEIIAEMPEVEVEAEVIKEIIAEVEPEVVKEIITEIKEVEIKEVVLTLPIISDRKLRKRRKKSL
jgi:hypothetical protein